MRVSRLIWVLFVLWLAAFAWSVWVMAVLPPEGTGFTRGLNRIEGFAKWQLVAGIIAMVIWFIGRGFAAGTKARWLSRGPGLLALLLILAIVGKIAFSWVSKPMIPQTPPASTQPKPVTDPVD